MISMSNDEKRQHLSEDQKQAARPEGAAREGDEVHEGAARPESGEPARDSGESVAGLNLEGASEEELENLVLDQHRKILDLEQRVEELREGQLRKAAELENMRKRTRRERAQMVETAKAEAIEHFLPINDDLRRSLTALDEQELDEKTERVLEGVRLVADKFEEVLKKYDVERIDETGVPFDVDLHDALMRKKVDDENVESDTVLEVLENGYRMGDRTIRFAKVIVSE